jgi:hypothetical protein
VVRRPAFAGTDHCRALQITLPQTEGKATTNTSAEALLDVWQDLSSLRELRLINLQTLDRKTKVAMRKASFESIEVLNFSRTPEAALFIAACPDLVTVRSDYPCSKMKTTFKAIMDSTAQNLELENIKGWRVAQFNGKVQNTTDSAQTDDVIADIHTYLGNIAHICLRGEIKAKVTVYLAFKRVLIKTNTRQELLDAMTGLPNVQSFAITRDPWVNYSYYSRHYFDDRYLDAIDYAKEESPLHEDQDEVFRKIFTIFQSAETAWVLERYGDADQRGVIRNADNTVASLVQQPLRPSGSAFEFQYSPFSTVFPKERSIFAHD